MLEQLESLFNLYHTNIEKFKFDNHESNVLEFNDRLHDDLLFTITLNKIENIYYIFLYIEKESKIMFKGLIHKSVNNLKDSYNQLLEDLSNMNLEEYISKYYTTLEKNFL